MFVIRTASRHKAVTTHMESRAAASEQFAEDPGYAFGIIGGNRCMEDHPRLRASAFGRDGRKSVSVVNAPP